MTLHIKYVLITLIITFIFSCTITMLLPRETLKPDSSIYQRTGIGDVVKKTNTEASKVFDAEVKMSSASFIIKKIQELNPDIELEIDMDRNIIFSSIKVEELNLPEWFYYNQKNGITNKHNTQSGIYGTVHVYPMEYSDPYAIYYN